MAGSMKAAGLNRCFQSGFVAVIGNGGRLSRLLPFVLGQRTLALLETGDDGNEVAHVAFAS